MADISLSALMQGFLDNEKASASLNDLMDMVLAMEEELSKRIQDSNYKRDKENVEAINALRLKHAFQNEKQENEYRNKLNAESLNAEREARIKLLKDLSEESKARAKAESEVLEREEDLLTTRKEIEEYIAALKKATDDAERENLQEKIKQAEVEEKKKAKALRDSTKAANLSKKEEERKKQKQATREKADAYSMSDTFRDAFSKFIEEKDSGFVNSARKTAAEDLVKTMQGVGKAITEGLNQINNVIKSYGDAQLAVNTRLQGSGNDFVSIIDTLEEIAYSPLLKAEDLYSNLKTLVQEGIVTNVEQRAFFQTVKSGIADTFDVNSSSLKRLIRVQQNDSTAARLGLESYLTRFLNAYVENTEYLTTTFDSVAESLFEASALLGSRESTEFEYIVQKWLGSLTGVGLSDATANSIAEAIGKLGSGNVEIFNSPVGLLLTMAASRNGMNIGEAINSGLNYSDTNRLLESMVEYLQEIAKSSTSNVVKQQLASVFGVTVSDLQAIMNFIPEEISKISANVLSYDLMYRELYNEMDTLSNRLGFENMLQNAFSNYKYQTGIDIASNKASYAMWSITDLIQGVTGGINIPWVTTMFGGMGLEATVEQLMKLGLVGVSTLGGIGKIIQGVGSVGNGSDLLELIGANADNAEIKERGSGLDIVINGKRRSGETTSASTYVGQSNSEIYQESVIGAAEDEANAKKNKLESEPHEKQAVDYLAGCEFDIKFSALVQNVEAIKDSMLSRYLPAKAAEAASADGGTMEGIR